MKFQALAVGLAAVVGAGAAVAQDYSNRSGHSGDHRSTSESRSESRGGHSSHSEHRTMRSSGDDHVFFERWSYYRDVMYPDLPSEEHVASKVRELVSNQQHEIAMLRGMAPRAQTAGFNNISSVYEHMAADHSKLVDFASQWLRERDFDVPAMRSGDIQPAADMSPEASVDEQIRMHQEAFNRSLAARENEKSATVRGMHLWAAATAARHIGLLRTLDRDVEFGRKNLSARLQMQMDTGLTASGQSDWMARIMEEDRIYFESLQRTTTTTVATATPAPEPQVIERVQVVEREVERQVEAPAPAPQPTITQTAPIERRVTTGTTTTTRSRVAGRRQSARGARRPAK